MDKTQLEKRIKSLNVSTIKEMSPDGLAMLTDEFQEPLVMEVMYRATTNREQRDLFAVVKAAYKKWMKENEVMWGGLYGERYPDFMNQLQLDIECGMVVTKEGVVLESSIMVPKGLTPTSLDAMMAATKRAITNNIVQVNNIEPIKALKRQIQSIEEENRQLKEANAELNQRIEEYMEEHTMSEKDIDAACSIDDVKGQLCEKNEEVDALKKRINELEEELSKKNECGDGDIKDLDDNQRLAIDERIIFFSSALGVSVSPEYINQKKMAALISALSGDKPESIRVRLLALNKEEKVVNEDADSTYSQSTKDAANNVYNYIASVSKVATRRTPAMMDLMKNIDLVYHLNKENKD